MVRSTWFSPYNMAPNLLDYRSAKNSAASPQVVQVELTATKGVVVRVAYPPGKFRGAKIGVAVTFGVFGIFAALWYHIGLLQNPWILLYLAVIPAAVSSLLVWRALSFCQSYTFQADQEGMTIERHWGRREWYECLPRERIDDIRLGFSKAGRGGGTAYLIIAIKPWYRLNRRLLHNLGGNHLARVADALRAGICLPPRSWP